MAVIKSINEHNLASISEARNFYILVEGVNGQEHLKKRLGDAQVGIVSDYFDTLNKGYEIGEIFIYDASLYIVKQQINIGETFNLEKVSKITLSELRPRYISAILLTSNWANNQQTLNINGVTESNNIFVSFAPTSIKEGGNHGVYCSEQATNSLTFVCETIPSADIEINVKIEN